MKKGTNFSKKEKRTVFFGYLHRWGVVLMIFMPLLFLIISQNHVTETAALGLLFYLSFGLSFLSFGIIDMLGALLEWKYILVAHQLAYRASPNPRKNWDQKQKKEEIFIGIIFTAIGLAIIVPTLLHIFGVI